MNVSYVTSKFGVRAITQTAALEWGQHNITVNAYAPGMIETPMCKQTIAWCAVTRFLMQSSAQLPEVKTGGSNF
jgi:NAD(P)-dependent dehydrogenase (short-subunit alcohol dehydrogenase family)